MSENASEHLALRLVRFLRLTKVSPRQTLSAIEELAGTAAESDSIATILKLLGEQTGKHCATLAASLRDARHREVEKVHNRRLLGETITADSSLLLGDLPAAVSTAWTMGTELQPLTEEAVQLLADVAFLDRQEVPLPVIRKRVAERFEAPASRVRHGIGHLIGDLIEKLPEELNSPDSELHECVSHARDTSRKRIRQAMESDGALVIRPGDHEVALEEFASALATADINQRRRIFDAVLDWPGFRAVPLIRQLCQSTADRERAELILTLRFGAGGNRGWESWANWLDQQDRIGTAEADRLREYTGEHAAEIVYLWYSGFADRSRETETALKTLCANIPEKNEFVDRWAEWLPPEEWNALDPESVRRIAGDRVVDVLSRGSMTTRVTSPPLLASDHVEPPPLPVSAPSVIPEIAGPRPQEPRKPSFWEVHVQPLITENWYVFAGIAMVIVGASLLAYYTWDKAWWIRYTIMPALLGGFTWGLPSIASWIERKGDEFKTMGATLRGAAIGLLPLNFMVVSLIARDATVPNKSFMALLMACVYLIVFGRGLLRWCSAVAPDLRWLAGGTLLLINGLVIVEPLSAAVFHSTGFAGTLNITSGFYAGFIAVTAATIRFTRSLVTVEIAAEKRIPWFFGGTIAVTFLQTFAWAHGMADPRPAPGVYSIMVIMAGWLVLFVERRNLQLFEHEKSYRTESFLGFAFIFLGILLSATHPILRIFAFLLGGGVWMYQSAPRRETVHHWIGLTLLAMGGAAIATTDGFPREWMAAVGVVMGLLLGVARTMSRSRNRERLALACAGMQMIVMLLTVVVAVLAQWHFNTAPLPTAIVLVLIGGHFIYAGLREDRLTWIHTAMMVLAIALPYLGFVDLEKRTLHGNTMVFGLSLLSFIWLAMLAFLRRPLLYSARSTVLWLYGTLAVVAMLVRVVLEQGTPANPLWYLNYMDYAGPLLMTVVLGAATYHSRSLVPALMAVFIVVILFPELKANLQNTFVDRLWGSGLGSASSSVGLLLLCFFLRRWHFLQNLADGDRFFGRDQFPLRRTDHTVFTWPILAAVGFLALKVDTWNLLKNLSLSGVPIKTAWAVCLTAVTWTLLGVYHAREKWAKAGTFAGAGVLLVGVSLVNEGLASEPHWTWVVFLTGIILQGLELEYRYALQARIDWVAEVLTEPTRACLRIGSLAVVPVVMIGIFFSREIPGYYWLSAFLAAQMLRHGIERRQAIYGGLLYGLGLVVAIALRHPGAGLLADRLGSVSSLTISLWFNVVVLLIGAWQRGPAMAQALRVCASTVTLTISCLLLGNVVIIDFWNMDGLWLLPIGSLLLAAAVNRSLPYVTLAMLLAYCGMLWPILKSISSTFDRLHELWMPWRLGLLSFGMVALFRLGRRVLHPPLSTPISGLRPGPATQFRDAAWIEFPAVAFALLAAAIQSFDADYRDVPLQTLAPYVGAFTLAMVGWFRRQGAYYCIAALLLFIGNMHLVRVFLGDGLRAGGLSAIHILCFGIGVSLGQLSLVRRFVRAENGGALLNQSGLVMAGTILVLLSANYLTHPNLGEITTGRFFFSGAMALMTGWYFRWASLSPGPGEEQHVNVTRGLYHFGVTMAIWCTALLIPVLRDPAVALFALTGPAIYFHLRTELGLRTGLPEALDYRNSAAVTGFIILALYTFKSAFQMLLFPGSPVDVGHYHCNAPLIVTLAFLLLRLHGLGGTSWLAFYGGLALMVGSYFLLTWIPGLSPFSHHLAAAWTAIGLGHFWIGVSVTKSPLRTFVQRLAQLDDPNWFTARKSWGLVLTIAIHAATLPALLDFDEHPLQIAPLLVGLASILVVQGIARRSASFLAIAGAEVFVALHADFMVPSYLARDHVVWVLLGLWTGGLVLHQLRTKWLPVPAMGKLALGCATAVGLHVLYHGPTVSIGWWAAAGGSLLAGLNPQPGPSARSWAEKLFAGLLLGVPTWLVFFGLFDRRGGDQTTTVLPTMFTIFATGAFARWFQARGLAGRQGSERTRFRLWDQTCAWMGSQGRGICLTTSALSMAAGFGVQLSHYGLAFSGFELATLLVLQAGLALAWYDAGRRYDSMIPSYLMQISAASFFITVRRHLMLTTGFWNYEYDVWAMLAASYCLAGLKPVFDNQPKRKRMPMFSTMILMPAVACGWVMLHHLGTDAALLVVGLYSLKFAFLGRDNRESPYNVVAIFGFVAFVLISFWGKLEVHYVHAYVLPVGIAVLVLLQLFGRHIDAATKKRVRFLTLIAMIGSAGYYALIDLRHEITFNLIVIGLCLVAMLLGSFFRIRLYLSMGMAGLMIDLASIVFKVMVSMERTSRMTTIGSLVLLIGAGLVFGAIYYKTHREMLTGRLNGLRDRLGAWE